MSRNAGDEKRVADGLEAMWRRLPTPDEADLHAIATAASTQPRRPADGAARAGTSRRRLRLRWAAVLAGGALVIGSALGFGLGSFLTPSGSENTIVGFGFLPSPGWNVLQTGTLDTDGVARAVAANVPLDARDDLRSEPLATIRRLPPSGVLISATFQPRGDAAVDATFPVRQLPLQLEDAEPFADGRSTLRAAIRGYNVELNISYGVTLPSRALEAAAQRQLDRLVVAAERVTMFARPTVVGGPGFNDYTVNLYGSVENRRAGESVAIQAKNCGTSFFRLVTGATTQAGGTWTWKYFPLINTTLRAVWDGSASAEIRIGRRASVEIEKDGPRRYQVEAAGLGSPFWRKQVVIQQHDSRLGAWRRLRTVVLNRPGSYGASSATFTLALPRGTLIRAVLPLSQTRPCYLAGTSRPIST